MMRRVFATGRHDVKNRWVVFQGHEDRRALSLVSPPENLDVWHRRMSHFKGHLNVNSLNKLKNGLATGVRFKESRMVVLTAISGLDAKSRRNPVAGRRG